MSDVDASHPGMSRIPPARDLRLGVLGRLPVGPDGKLMLTMPDGGSALVPPDLTCEQVAARYDLDQVVRMPETGFCAGVCLDGPLAGRSAYAIHEIGQRTEIMLPPRPGGPVAGYEVVALARDGEPAQLRFVGYAERGTG